MSSSQIDKYAAETLLGAETRRVLYEYVLSSLHTYVLRMITIARTSYYNFVCLWSKPKRPSATRHGASAHSIFLHIASISRQPYGNICTAACRRMQGVGASSEKPKREQQHILRTRAKCFYVVISYLRTVKYFFLKEPPDRKKR